MDIRRYIEKVKRDYREYIEEEEIEQECYVIYYEKKAEGYSDNAVYKAIKVRMEQMKNDNITRFYITPTSVNLGIVGIAIYDILDRKTDNVRNIYLDWVTEVSQHGTDGVYSYLAEKHNLSKQRIHYIVKSVNDELKDYLEKGEK